MHRSKLNQRPLHSAPLTFFVPINFWRHILRPIFRNALKVILQKPWSSVPMASLILLFSEIVRNHEWDAAALLAAYPSSSYSTLSSRAAAAAAARKSLRNQSDKQNNQSTEEVVMENPLESRVCVDFVWP